MGKFELTIRQFKAVDFNYQLIDVRTIEEHKEYNIGGINIPLAELALSLHKIGKAKPIILYCKSGSRSRQAAEFLLGNGFDSVYSLAGNIEDV